MSGNQIHDSDVSGLWPMLFYVFPFKILYKANLMSHFLEIISK